MIGAVIGDIAGSRFEFHNYRNKDFDLFSRKCFVTDDSIMTMCVAKAIMEASKKCLSHNAEYYSVLKSITVEYMQKIGRNYPDCGYGGMFYKWIYSDNPVPYNSFGNGAAMRISPVGFYAESEEEVKKMTYAVTSVSHNHKEGIKGAECTAMAIFKAREGYDKNAIKKYVCDNYYKIDFTLDDIRDTYKFNETCQQTVPQAVEAFIESDSFEDAIKNAISIGGDSDTLAAITGGIAESYYGVPDDMVIKAIGYFDKTLIDIYNDWNLFITK